MKRDWTNQTGWHHTAGGRGRGEAHRGRGGHGPPSAWEGGGRTPRGGGGRFRGGGPGVQPLPTGSPVFPCAFGLPLRGLCPFKQSLYCS